VTSLNIRGNDIGEKGISHIQKMMIENHTITELVKLSPYLEQNRIEHNRKSLLTSTKNCTSLYNTQKTYKHNVTLYTLARSTQYIECYHIVIRFTSIPNLQENNQLSRFI